MSDQHAARLGRRQTPLPNHARTIAKRGRISLLGGQVQLSKPTANLSHETHRILENAGFRAAFSVDAGRVVLRSRRGTEIGSAFPEVVSVVSGAVQLPDATALDGELVVRDAAGRRAFEQLQNRLQRRGARAARAAGEWPAHFVAFDLLRLSGTETTGWPYRRRREALESVCAARRLSAPWVLCPSATDPDTVREWLSWASVGMKGVLSSGWIACTSTRPPNSPAGSRPRKSTTRSYAAA
ncbi:hypothetical protein [Streptomyces sp. NPDC047079]|uniref:ATP-dependent DNA ligase n=1 Tax=Streptomyces sp. NPDC047079 TaxID=3154607 RepID=UPI0034092067